MTFATSLLAAFVAAGVSPALADGHIGVTVSVTGPILVSTFEPKDSDLDLIAYEVILGNDLPTRDLSYSSLTCFEQMGHHYTSNTDLRILADASDPTVSYLIYGYSQ